MSVVLKGVHHMMSECMLCKCVYVYAYQCVRACESGGCAGVSFPSSDDLEDGVRFPGV